MGSISILRNENFQKFSVYGIIFFILFTFGILAGQSIGKAYLSQIMRVNQAGTEKSIIMGNGQRNLLVIGVQDLTAPEPVLESIWLLILYPRDANISLLPIFPVPDGGVIPQNNALMKSFSLSSQHIPESFFFDQLRQQFWWDNYILIDKAGLSNVLDIIHQFSSAKLGTILESIPSTWENPNEALQRQTELLKTACKQLERLPNSIKSEILIQQIDDQIYSDLNWSEFIRGWSSNRPVGYQIECEFPTLILENQ